MQTSSDILSGQGPLTRLIPDYRVRPQQIEMAEMIALSIAGHESLICEAGTGTGKTFAYLIPAVLSGAKVIVSTGTRHLQDQLYQRDLQIIREAVGVPVHCALLKGRANYLCRHRLDLAAQDTGTLSPARVSLLHTIRQWSQQTISGDLGEFPGLPEEDLLRKLVTSTAENCLGQECSYYDDCFVFKARRGAGEADLTVVNHHLLLADMALREQGFAELLPSADVIIFDEAHQLPELASEFFSETLSSHQLFDLIRDCRAAWFQEAADMPGFLEQLDRMETAVRQLRLSFEMSEPRIAWHRVRDLAAVSTALADLIDRCQTVHDTLDVIAGRGKDLDNCYKRLAVHLDVLDRYRDAQTEDRIQWLEIRGNGFLLHQTPLDIAAAFQSHMARYGAICVYTSATLAVNGGFAHFAGQLGLDGLEQKAWPSPFDFRRQAMLYLPAGLPDPRAADYTAQVVEMAVPLLQLTRGRAFFLFTSHKALQLAAQLIRERLDYPVFIQGEAPRTELLESFRDSGQAVLLGTQSFWEGVDVKGQALSCVIIDKLPFATPDDPVLQARMKKLEQQGRNPFMEYQLPEAVITLKQGVGRLIRDSEDYGILVICDPRLRTKSYGRTFMKSLPDMHTTSSLQEVAAFLSRHEAAHTP